MELKEENLRYSTDRELFKAIFDVDNMHVEEVFKRSEVELIDRYHLEPDIALKLKVLCELAVRLQKRGAEEKLLFCAPSSVAAYLMASMRRLEKEEMHILCLNTKHELIDEVVISVGTINKALVEPREVFLAAMNKKAVRIILSHNHPSGNPSPSPEDISITKRIESSGELLGIELLDHIIIGDGRFVSLKEKGYL